MEEFEIKFLEVDVPELEKKLIKIGARKVAEYDYSRILFDYPDFRMNKKHSFLKLRTDGKETTLSYKERLGVKSDDGSIPDGGMKEIEVTVDNYEKSLELLKSLGLIIKNDMKNKRIRYQKGEVVFDIDLWPHIPPYVEIESNSLEKARDAALLLGFDLKDELICSPKEIYQKYGINLDDYYSITFEGMAKKD